MAYYAALLSIIELLDDILHPLRFPNSFPDDDTLTFKSLHQKFTHLLDSLQDYSFIGRTTDPVEPRIKDASYQALDLIESQIPEHIQHDASLGWFNWVKDYLQKVGQEVDSIVQHITAIKQSQTPEHVPAAMVSEQRRQPLIERGNGDTKTTMVGFEEQALTIKELLCGASPQLQVIPIVGMGGIGKTTLATHTFHDPLIVREFDFRGWVAISQDYDVIRVLQDLVNSLGITVTFPHKLSDEAHGNATVEERKRKKERALKEGVHKHLKWRKFLIVIDDIWNTQVWDDMRQTFPNDCNGSRIVLTTRLGDVAEYVAGNDFIHSMQFLNAGASWTLLRDKAFANDPCPSELVHIGKAISSKCSGLPIAVVVIGGILSNCKTLQYWENVANDVGSILSEKDANLSNILSLSYNHLPHRLRPCFLHMGSFPEDFEINISELVKLWSAEGFLNTTSKTKCSEEIGKDYLEDLVRRNLVIIKKKRASGEIKSCIMHDVLRDFCRQKALDEHFFHVRDKNGRLEVINGLEKIRRICVRSNQVPFTIWANDGIVKYVRSIYQPNIRPLGITVENLKNDKVHLLRILDAVRLTAPLPAFPRMDHLKYLALCPSSEKELCMDPIISNLQNLETLLIYSSRHYRLLPLPHTVSLPSAIWKMWWLKYLIVHPDMRLPPIPPNAASLQKLEYLNRLQIVRDFKFTNEVIRMIPNLRKLKVKYWMDVDNIWEFCGLNNLHKLLQLETLNLHMVVFCGVQNEYDLVKSGFGFPQNLKKLTLRGCQLPWEAMTLVGSLKCLQLLKLINNAFVGGDVWEPVEGEFLQLQFLLLENLYDLNQWRAESTHFPQLQHLKIINCLHLLEIPIDIGDIGALQSITVIDSKLAGVSAMKIQEEQQELGNYELQVEVRPW